MQLIIFKPKASYYLFFLVAFIVLLLPLTVYGQGIVECGGVGQRSCEFCDFANMARAIFNFIIAALVIIAGIVLAVAGLFLVVSGGDNAYREQAKTLMVNTVVGLILVLTAWLLIDIIMKTLYDESQFGPWNTIECVVANG